MIFQLYNNWLRCLSHVSKRQTVILNSPLSKASVLLDDIVLKQTNKCYHVEQGVRHLNQHPTYGQN